MDFTLDDEKLALQAAARRFAQEKMAPVAAQYDQSAEFPTHLMEEAWKLGLSSTSIPTELGGVGLSSLESCIVTEELSWACSGMTTSMMCNDLGLMPIIVGGSADQKKEWLGLCAGNFKIISFCLSEPAAGSDVASGVGRPSRTQHMRGGLALPSSPPLPMCSCHRLYSEQLPWRFGCWSKATRCCRHWRFRVA